MSERNPFLDEYENHRRETKKSVEEMRAELMRSGSYGSVGRAVPTPPPPPPLPPRTAPPARMSPPPARQPLVPPPPVAHVRISTPTPPPARPITVQEEQLPESIKRDRDAFKQRVRARLGLGDENHS